MKGPGLVKLRSLNLPTIRLRGFSPRREWPAYCAPYTGQAALNRLLDIQKPQAETLLSLCAAALSLYPAWERRNWVMPEPERALQVHGGHLLDLDALVLRLGGVSHLPGRFRYLHVPSGLAFAAHVDAQNHVDVQNTDALNNVTLVLGGTNSSHTDSQARTFPAEMQQLRADLLNVVGRVPRLYRTADLLTLLLRDELARTRQGRLQTLVGHSLGGGLAQYAGLMNGLPVLAFSPTALGRGLLDLLERTGRLVDPTAVLAQVRAYSLNGDPIPALGTGWLQTCVVGEHLRLPLAASVPPVGYATSHGQMYAHLAAHLQHKWPELPDALEPTTPAPDEEGGQGR